VKYQIRQNVFSIRSRFIIKDEHEQPRYTVEGKFFSLGKQLTLYNMQGVEEIYIEQKIFRFLPEYHFYKKRQHIATIKKEISFLRPRYYIESNQGHYEIEGNVFAYDFKIIKNKKMIAIVNKRWFSFGDTYGVEISDCEDVSFILALVIVLDQIHHEDQKNHSS